MFSAIKSAFTTETTPGIALPNGVTSYDIPVSSTVIQKYMDFSQGGGNTILYHLKDSGVKSIESALKSVGYTTSVNQTSQYKRTTIGVYKGSVDTKNSIAIIDDNIRGTVGLQSNNTYLQLHPTIGTSFDTESFKKEFQTVYSVVNSWAQGRIGGKRRKTYKKKRTSRKTKRHSR